MVYGPARSSAQLCSGQPGRLQAAPRRSAELPPPAHIAWLRFCSATSAVRLSHFTTVRHTLDAPASAFPRQWRALGVARRSFLRPPRASGLLHPDPRLCPDTILQYLAPLRRSTRSNCHRHAPTRAIKLLLRRRSRSVASPSSSRPAHGLRRLPPLFPQSPAAAPVPLRTTYRLSAREARFGISQSAPSIRERAISRGSVRSFFGRKGKKGEERKGEEEGMRDEQGNVLLWGRV